MRYLAALVFCLSLCSSLSAQQPELLPLPSGPAIAAPEPTLPLANPFSREHLEVFVDGLMSSQFEAYHLAGAVVVVVKDDEILLSRGYGRADLRTEREVDPAATLFRLGDTSRIFVWTALMQLAEQNRLDLNRDVNTYLKEFKVPDAYPQPVTSADLMGHTAGFEARYLGMLLPAFSDIRPLESTLSASFPERVRPPGTVAAYSDYGAALGALIVQEISGETWADYLASKILDPLGMSRTSIAQPLEPSLADDLSRGYFFDEGRLERADFEIVRLPSALGMSTTGEDMGRFVIAQLQAGSYHGGRILQPETVSRMQSELYTQDARFPGMAYGFITRQVNEQRLVGHSGGLLYFHSELWMDPDQHVGFFVAYNSEDGVRAGRDFSAALIDHWFPSTPSPANREPVGLPGRAQVMTGSYLPTRRPFTTIDKLTDWMAYANVRVGKDGLLLTELPGRGPQEWQEYEPFAFRECEGSGRLLFKVDSANGRTLLLLGDNPELAFEKLPDYESPEFHVLVVSLAGLLFFSTLAFPVIRSLLVRRSDEMLARRDVTHPLIRGLASFLSLINLAFLAGLLYLLGDPLLLLRGVPASMVTLLVLPVVSGSLTLIMMIVTFFAWRGGYWGMAARLHYSFVTLAALAFLWELNFWNLLGWRF